MTNAKWEGAVRRLNELKERRGMTLVEISEDSGIPKSTLNRWFLGDITPQVDKLYALAETLGTSVSYIIEEGNTCRVPVLGKVKCGPNGVLREEYGDYIYADVPHPEKHFFLRAEGNSMEPRILDGDLVLIREQDDVENGEIAAVLYPDEFEQMQTLKKVVRRGGATILQPLNPAVEPLVFYGEEQNGLRIVGKAVRVYGVL